MSIIQRAVKNPVLLGLVHKALRRTETWGGLFYDYEEKSLPLGSPLSPLLGAIVLLPLVHAMENIKDIFFCLFMDDWIILAKTKTALQRVVKLTHKIINLLKLELHPTKTYIGKISHGFNFLGYYFDDHKLLPSRESVKRLQERAGALLCEAKRYAK